jgi:hypothetical protein
VIALGQQGYGQTFAPGTGDPYLSRTLARQGELIPHYYGVAAGELANEIALVSGQGPTPQTEADCPQYVALLPGSSGALGQRLGSGCVYPPPTGTLASQLAAAHRTFRAYVQGLGTTGPQACLHPRRGAADDHAAASARNPYVTWRNPLVYFAGVTGRSSCAQTDVGFGALAGDLRSAARTPTVSLITPDPCDDGSPTPCTPGAHAGLGPADALLRRLVPEITGSPAYRSGGLLLITFAQAPQSGPDADASACCDLTLHYPNLPAATAPGTATGTGTTATPAPGPGVSPAGGSGPYAIAPTGTGTTTTPTGTGTTPTGTGTTPTDTGTTPTGTGTTPTGTGTTAGGATPGKTTSTGGGGQVGLLVLSKFVNAGTTDPYGYFNHFALLGSIEQLFKLPLLGYAADPSLTLFNGLVYSAYSPTG